MTCTDWEAGQVLVKLHDELGEAYADLIKSHPDLAAFVHGLRLQVGDRFNDMDTDTFQLSANTYPIKLKLRKTP